MRADPHVMRTAHQRSPTTAPAPRLLAWHMTRNRGGVPSSRGVAPNGALEEPNMNLRIVVTLFIAASAAACGKSGSDAPAGAETGAATPPAASTAAAPAPTPAPSPAAPAAAAPAAAEVQYHWETHKKTNVKFEIPTTWTTDVKGDVLVAKTPTPGAGIEFVAATGGLAAKNDEKAMLAEVGKVLQGAKLTSPLKPATQHGLKGFVATGSGKKNGADVEWFTSALGDGKGHTMLTIGFFGPGAAAYKAQIVHVLDSIQPAA
jgi:hypothetical protein